MHEIRLGNVYNNEKFTGGNYGGHIWDTESIAPTMKTGASASQQCVCEIKHLTSEEGEKTCLSRAEQSRAEQSRAEQLLSASSNKGRNNLYESSGSCRLELSDLTNEKRQSADGGADMSYSDNGEYP